MKGERGVLAADRPVVMVVATRKYVYWLGWEIDPVSGGNIVTYECGDVLSTLAMRVLLLRELWTGSTSQTVRLG